VLGLVVIDTLRQQVVHIKQIVQQTTAIGKGSTFAAGQRSPKIPIRERPAPLGFPALRIRIK